MWRGSFLFTSRDEENTSIYTKMTGYNFINKHNLSIIINNNNNKKRSRS